MGIGALFGKPDFSSPGAGARSGARMGAAGGPLGLAIGAGIGALGGWLSARQNADAAGAAGRNSSMLNDRLSSSVNWQIGGPLSQFSGASQPGQGDDSITDDLGISDFGAGREGSALAEGGDFGDSAGPGGMPSSGYSQAGGGYGAGVWNGGGGMRSYQVNTGSLSASNYSGLGGGGISRGRGRENGASQN